MNIIKFKRDTSFRNDLFTPDSFAHPAKMDSQLLIWIVEHFTKEGGHLTITPELLDNMSEGIEWCNCNEENL